MAIDTVTPNDATFDEEVITIAYIVNKDPARPKAKLVGAEEKCVWENTLHLHYAYKLTVLYIKCHVILQSRFFKNSCIYPPEKQEQNDNKRGA